MYKLIVVGLLAASAAAASAASPPSRDKKPDMDEGEVGNRDGGDDCEDDSGWEKHPAKKGKTLDCDWVARSPKKRCKKKNKGGTKASKACACACA